MTTHRQLIADQISADDPDIIVNAFPASAPTGIPTGKAFVSVYRESIKPIQNSLESSLTVEIMTNAGTTIAAEDELDAVLNSVLLSIERIPGVVWTEAVRTNFDEKYFGYKVTVSIPNSPNVYKNIVRSESES